MQLGISHRIRCEIEMTVICILFFCVQVFSQQYSMADFSNNLQQNTQGQQTNSTRVLFVCQDSYVLKCFSVSATLVAEYQLTSSYSYSTDTSSNQQTLTSKILLDMTQNPINFPPDSLTNVHFSTDTMYLLGYWQTTINTADTTPATQNLSNDKSSITTNSISYFCFSISSGIFESETTISNIQKLQSLEPTEAFVFEKIEGTAPNTVRSLYYFTCGIALYKYSYTIPNDAIYWSATNQSGMYSITILLAFSNRIETYYVYSTQASLISTYTLNNGGVISDVNAQITTLRSLTRIKYFDPVMGCAQFLEFNSNGKFIMNVALPYVKSDQLSLATAGISDDVFYQQYNNTVLISYNSTFFEAVVNTAQPIFLMRLTNTILLINENYIDAINLTPANGTSDATTQTSNANMHLLIQRRVGSPRHQEILNAMYPVAYNWKNQQEKSSETDMINNEERRRYLGQQQAETPIFPGIQYTQQGQALYVREYDPIQLKNENGQIQVNQLEINVYSAFIITQQNSYLYSQQSSAPKAYFSAKVNGQWRIVQASQQQIISSSTGLGFWNVVLTALMTYWTLRGIVSILQSVFLQRSIKDLVGFLDKERSLQISHAVFTANYCVDYENELGKGSYGIVYPCSYTPLDSVMKAWSKTKNQLLACKIIANSPQNKDDIMLEIEALKSVRSCKSAIKLFNYCISESQIYIVLERAEQSLDTYLKMRFQQPFTSEEVVQIALDLTEVLIQLRENNFNHRDIKPSNILIMPDKQVKLTDFGAAQQKDLSNYTIQNDQLIGSIPWMAPELVRALENTRHVSDSFCVSNIDYEKCDIYSLGLTLVYVVLRIKLQGMNHKEEKAQHFYHLLDTDYSYIDKDLRIMLKRMTSFDPQKRPSVFIIKKHLLKIQGYTFPVQINAIHSSKKD